MPSWLPPDFSPADIGELTDAEEARLKAWLLGRIGGVG